MTKKACWGVVLGLTMLVGAAGVRADVTSPAPDVAEPTGFDSAWTDDLASFGLSCSGVDFSGCCEAGVLFYCNDDDHLDAIECGRNEDATVCATHEDPVLANCMMPDETSLQAPRCSNEPAPYAGEASLPDPGALAGTCPTLPSTMTFELAANPHCPDCGYCDSLPMEVTFHQLGCAFVATPPYGASTGVAVGQMDGRVVQMSFRVGGGTTIATCLGEILEDDSGFRGLCDGSWGYGDSACRFNYVGAVDWDWQAPEPELEWPEPGTQPDAGVTTGGDDGGSGGCSAGSPSAANGLLLLLAAVAFALSFRRRSLLR